MTVTNVYDVFRGIGVPVTLTKPDSFNIIRESLTRIGVAAKNENILYPSAILLHKRGLYTIVHFKEMFLLDGKPSTITENDYFRRNTIAKLLEQWELLKLVEPIPDEQLVPISQLKILSFADKKNWEIREKYTMGNKKV